MTSNTPNYRCPLCQQGLILTDKVFRCENNHCFDQAKEGYVNLLPVQHKHSKDPGDNKEMVNARRAFLDKVFINHWLIALPLYIRNTHQTMVTYLMPGAVKVFIPININ